MKQIWITNVLAQLVSKEKRVSVCILIVNVLITNAIFNAQDTKFSYVLIKIAMNIFLVKISRGGSKGRKGCELPLFTVDFSGRIFGLGSSHEHFVENHPPSR